MNGGMVSVSDHKRILVTPCRWWQFGGSATLFLLCLVIYAGIDAAPDNPGRIFLVVFLIILLINTIIPGVHYSITHEGIIVNWIGIPLRKIKWSQVGHAEYLHLWKDTRRFYTDLGRGLKTGQMIYVTLTGCPQYLPEYEYRAVHNRLHPFRAMSIWLPRETWYEYMELFKEYYPELVIQPIDNSRIY